MTTEALDARLLERDRADPFDARVLRTNLFCVWSISFLSAIDGTVAVPSLWRYIESLGGSEEYYGLCVSAFAVARVAFMGVFGLWVDRRPFREVFAVSLAVGVLASAVYALAPTFGLPLVLAGRFILGATSAVSVATQAFVSSQTTAADRTKYMSINTAIANSLSICGPAFNLAIVALPRARVALGGATALVFDHFTYVGHFLALAQAGVLAAFCASFVEPPRKPRRAPRALGALGRCLTLGGLFPWPRVALDPWLRRTRAWTMVALAFRTNALTYAVTYAIPLVTARDYGFGQLENSLAFGAISVVRIAAVAAVALATARATDRRLLATLEGLSALLLLALVLPSRATTRAIPMPLFVAACAALLAADPGPVVLGLYSKLIGAGNAGLYFAVLQSNGAIARAAFGQVVGFAYGRLGPLFLWAACGALLAASWAIILPLWPRLSPEAIEAMHAALASDEDAPYAAVASAPEREEDGEEEEGEEDDEGAPYAAVASTPEREKDVEAVADDARATAENSEAGSRRKLNCVVLHGLTMNADRMRAWQGMCSIEKRCGDIATFYYVTAPHTFAANAWSRAHNIPVREDSYTWFTHKRPPDYGFGASWAHIAEFVAAQVPGPIDVLIGYSQGGLMVATLLRYLAEVEPYKAVRAAVFIHAPDFLSKPPSEKLSPAVRTLHVIGRADTLVAPTSSTSLAGRFVQSEISTHGGPHYTYFPAPFPGHVLERVRRLLLGVMRLDEGRAFAGT